MWKFIFVLIVVVSSYSLSCESTVSMQSQDAPKTQPSSTITPEEKQYKRNSEYHYNEALKMRAAGKIAEAIEEFKKAIEVGNDDKETYREVARLLILQKRYEEAEIYLRKVLEKDSKDVRAHWALAGLLVEHLEKYEEGLKEALISKELDSSDTSYVIEKTLGRAYEGLGDYENAIKHYRIFLKESSYAPDAADYKKIQKRLSELQKNNPN